MRKNKLSLLLSAILLAAICLICSCVSITVTIDSEPITMNVEEERSIGYEVEGAEIEEMTFEVADDTVVSVDAEGNIVALKEGATEISAKITAVNGNKSETAEVKIAVTVVEDRTVTITLDLNGGTASESSKTIKYGTSYALPTATKEGYEFLGWKKAGATEYVSTLTDVKENVTVVAEYAINAYDLTYVLDGATYDAAQAKAEWGSDVTLGTPVKAGYRFLGWTLEENSTDYVTELKAVKEAKTLYAHFEEIVHNVTYALDGGTNAEGNPTTFGEATGATLADPTKEGYTFAGWTIDGKAVTSIAAGTNADVTLTATWTEIKHTITYELDGGVNAADAPTEFNELTEVVLKEATKEGYKFLGWYDGETKVEKIAAGTKADVKLTAKWEQTVAQANVGFDAGEGTIEGTAPTTYLKGIDAPITVTAKADGKVFLGWYNGSTKVTNLKDLDGTDVTLVAKYGVQGNITYVIGDGTLDLGYANLEEVGAAFMVDFNAANGKTGYTVDQLDTNSIDSGWISKMGDGEYLTKWTWLYNAIVEITGKTEMDPAKCDWSNGDVKGFYLANLCGAFTHCKHQDTWLGTVSYDWSKSEELLAPYIAKQSPVAKTYVTGDEGALAAPTPAEGKVFLGWYIGDKKVSNLNELPGGDVTLTAKYMDASAIVTPNEGETLAQTYARAEAGATIMLPEGDYTLDFVIDKNITFLGAGYGTNISVKKDISGNLNAAYIKFDSVTLTTGLPGYGSGVTFQAGANMGEIIFVNSLLTSTNTFLKLQNGTNAKVTVNNCEIERIGQFFVWITKGVEEFTFTNNTYTLTNCASVSNANGAQFRIRYGSAYIYNNTFIGDLPDNSLFDASSSSSKFEVKYNVFKDVTKWFAAPQANEIIFDNNAYLGTCAAVSGKGAVVDTTTYATAEEVQAAYAAYLAASKTHAIEYVLNEGTNPENAPATFTEGATTTLPTPTREGYSFLGWTKEETGTDYVTEVGSETADVKLYAQWEKLRETLKVGEGEKYTTIAAALEAANAGALIKLAAGTYAEEVTIAKDGITIEGPNAGVNYAGERAAEAIISKAVKITAKSVTIDGVKFTEGANVDLGGSDGVQVLNDYFVGVTPVNTFYSTRSAVLGATADFTNSTIKGCYFETGVQGAFITNSVVTNCTFTENKVVGSLNSEAYIDDVRLNNVAGKIVITNNIFNFGTDNFGLFLGSGSANCEEINIVGNAFGGSSTGYHTCGISVRNLVATAVVNIIANTFENVDGTVLDVKLSSGTFNVKYNEFGSGVHYQEGNVNTGTTAVTINYDSNYYKESQATATSDAGEIKSVEELKQLYSKYVNPVTSKIEYVLDGGTNAEGAPVTYAEGQVTKLLGATREGYEFLGWALSADATEYVTEIGRLQEGDVKLYAKWRRLSLEVGEGKTYATIAAALADAQDGDTIVLAAGTYDEAVTIAKSITLAGPNKGVKGTGERAAEAVISQIVKITADNVVIDGIKLTGSAAIDIAANNVTIQNIYANEIKSTLGFSVSSRTSVVGVSCAAHDIKLLDSFIDTGNVTQQCAFISNFTVTNVTVSGCYIQNEISAITYEDAIRFNNIAGVYNINDNEFHFGTDNFTIFIGTSSNNCTLININNNKILASNDGTEFQTCGIAVRNLKAGGEFYFVGNTVENAAGTVIGFNNLKGVAYVMYNNFGKNVSYKTNETGVTGTINYVDNYYMNAQTTATSDATAIADTAALATAYAAYQASEAAKVYGEIEYVVNGGSLPFGSKTKYEQGKEFTLAIPTLKDYEFVGWYLNADFSGDAVTTIAATQTGKVTVYAKFAQFAKLTFTLNEGTLDNAPARRELGADYTLPTPTREGYVFCGWYDNADFAGSAIAVLKGDDKADYTLYALWQIVGKFNVTYVLNGGNTEYNDRATLVADLLADYKSFSGKKVTAANFFDSSYGPTYAQIEPFFTSGDTGAKWGWLLTYLKGLDAQGYKPKTTIEENYTSSAAWIRGCLHNFINGDNSCNYGIDCSMYATGNGFWGQLQKEVKVTDATSILSAYYPYYTFIGWYDNAELTGTPVRTLTQDTTLYAKYVITEHTITYVLNNTTEGIAMPEDAKTTFTAAETFKLAEPTHDAKHWTFNGWFTDEKCTQPIEAIAECTDKDVTLYASWTQVLGFTINYVVNGGSVKYHSVDEVIADFVKDYNAALNHSYADAAAIPTGIYVQTDFDDFMDSSVDGVTMRSKWTWLAQFLYDITVEKTTSTGNISGMKKLLAGQTITGDSDPYAVSYVFRAFLQKSQYRPTSSSFATVDFSNVENQIACWSYLSKAEVSKSINNVGDTTPATPFMYNYDFLGWYLTSDLSGEKVVTVNESNVDDANQVTLYAKFGEGTLVTEIQVASKEIELKKFDSQQLTWTIVPENANVKSVTFASSDEKIVTVSDTGMLQGVSEGTATITIKSNSSSGVSVDIVVKVYSPDHFEISYETTSYVDVDKEIQLNAELVKKDGTTAPVTFTSQNADIATVDANGMVKGLKAGVAKITAAAKGTDGSMSIDFVVTVLDSGLTDAIKFVVENHNSNALTRYNLGIGAGTPAYYCDIIGSVNNILFNEDLEINKDYYEEGSDRSNHNAAMSSVEFITVHYTGNMAKTSDGDNNAQYFSSSNDVSIHFVTGTLNNTSYKAFAVLNEKYGGWHASDSAQGDAEWRATGVKVESSDPAIPVISIADGYFTINGRKTTYAIPTRSDGVVVTGPTFVKDGVTYNSINQMGLAWKIVNGEYYMDKVWWGTQAAGWALSNVGGNHNSIGIESCVDLGVDLMHVWQKTAQLVATLLVKYNLGFERVVGHHFFSGKDCPQPLLENDMELWYVFMDCVKAEYAKITTYKNSTFKMEVVSGGEVVKGTKGTEVAAGITGRLIQDESAHIVTYKVTVDGKEITLATAINSIYSDNTKNTNLAIQKNGYVLY